MDLPIETWHAAILKRRSRRTYLSNPVESGKLEKLEAVCRNFRPFPGARSELVLNSPEHIFQGIVGRYGRVNGALHYIAFIGNMDAPHVQEATGYMGEGVILEATALGLGTCWVGGFFRPEAVRRSLPLSENERVLSITPVGYPVPREDFSERLLEGLAGSRRRKSLTDLVLEGSPSGWAGKALEAARLAPSARNRQPWRFRVQSEAILVSEDGKPSLSSISKRLDCGIAMLHLELGSRAAGVQGRWEFLEFPDVARFVPENGERMSIAQFAR
jgi:nitroreductase